MRTHSLVRVGGMDEVGRGALAGPVSVGVVVVDAATRSAPPGLDDSKRLSALERERLHPLLARWAPGVGGRATRATTRSTPGASSSRCAWRACGRWPSCRRRRSGCCWTARTTGCTGPSPPRARRRCSTPSSPSPRGPAELRTLAPAAPPVDLLPKADRRCAAVAAASVLAKVERDRLMAELGEQDHRWGWQHNKGYSAPEHLAALAEHGPCAWHRRSWRLPTGRASRVDRSPTDDDAPLAAAAAPCETDAEVDPTDHPPRRCGGRSAPGPTAPAPTSLPRACGTSGGRRRAAGPTGARAPVRAAGGGVLAALPGRRRRPRAPRAGRRRRRRHPVGPAPGQPADGRPAAAGADAAGQRRRPPRARGLRRRGPPAPRPRRPAGARADGPARLHRGRPLGRGPRRHQRARHRARPRPRRCRSCPASTGPPRSTSGRARPPRSTTR